MCSYDDIDVISAIYFIMSTLTTTGIYNPYSDETSLFFLFLGLYMIIGVIIGGTALVYISRSMHTSLLYVRLDRQFDVPVTVDEIQELVDMTVIPRPMTTISRQEYLIMMTIRMDILNEELISSIFQQYDENPPVIQVSQTPTSNPSTIIISDADSENSKLLS